MCFFSSFLVFSYSGMIVKCLCYAFRYRNWFAVFSENTTLPEYETRKRADDERGYV